MSITAPITTNILVYSPQIYINKSIIYQEYLAVHNKQYRPKQSRLWILSTLPLNNKLLSNLKTCSVTAFQLQPKQAT